MYHTELMTGFVQGPGVKMPLSEMTVLAMADLGYQVDPSNADPYTVPNNSGRRLRVEPDEEKEEKIILDNDVLNFPMIELDENMTSTIVKPGREEEYQQKRAKYAERKAI